MFYRRIFFTIIAVSIETYFLSTFSATPTYTLLKIRETDHSYIGYIQDSHSQLFLVKQKKNYPEQKIAQVIINEALAAYIAHMADIKAHQVWIITAKQKHIGKKISHLPATLHSYMYGQHIQKNDLLWPQLDIQLKSPQAGAIYPEYLYNLIIQMARHPDLAAIVALDTFLGNNDRHLQNLLYNKIEDAFYAIDMDCILQQNLAQLVYQTVAAWLSDTTIIFTQQELYALEQYKQSLFKLVTHLNVKKIGTITKQYLKDIGNKNLQKLLVDRIEIFFTRTIPATIKLVSLIEEFIIAKSVLLH